jgi:hypothetical protein
MLFHIFLNDRHSILAFKTMILLSLKSFFVFNVFSLKCRKDATSAQIRRYFEERPRVAEAVPPYLALKLGGRVWVGVAGTTQIFLLTGTEPATR